jgi:hypothetical protein
MEVTFRKGKQGRTCGWVALRPPRTTVPGTTMAAGGDVPHDLATFVIEQALGIAHGFWGCVAAGATFRTLGRSRTPQGRAVIDRHLDELDVAEQRVNEVYFAWRSGEPTPADEALDAALHEWRRLPEGGEMVRIWDADRGRITSASGSRIARTRPRVR